MNTRLAIAAALSTMAMLTAATAEPISWHDDLRTAHELAQASGKPLLLHFTTDRCVWCDRLEAGAFKNADVQSAVARGFVPVKIHAGKQPELAQMFKVRSFPTDVVVTTGGKALSHQVSPQDPTKYVAMLKATREMMGPVDDTMFASTTAETSTATTQAGTEPTPQINPTHINPTTINPNVPDAAAAQLASARVDAGMSLPPNASPPSDVSASTLVANASDPPTLDPGFKPELALEGYCSVSVIQDAQWVAGKPEHGVIHLGQLYLFADEAKMQDFLADPVPYTPMLNGIDVVRFFEERVIVPGRREFSAVDPDHNRVFLFADEAALSHFEQTFERYVDSAISVMDQAISESNPSVN